MKSRVHLIAIIILIAGCSRHEQALVGVYKSEDPNLLKKAWKYFVEGYDGFILGTELRLESDSSFQMSTCGNLLGGKWYAANDTLYLNYETNRWRNDSLDKGGFYGKWPQVPVEIEKVECRGKKLIFNWESSEGDKMYDVLKKWPSPAQNKGK